jgi:hypothetical protein
MNVKIFDTLIFIFSRGGMKMRRIVLIICCLLLLSGSFYAFADRVATLDELINPDEIHVDQQQLYVVEGIKIFIYFLAVDRYLRQKTVPVGRR